MKDEEIRRCLAELQTQLENFVERRENQKSSAFNNNDYNFIEDISNKYSMLYHSLTSTEDHDKRQRLAVYYNLNELYHASRIDFRSAEVKEKFTHFIHESLAVLESISKITDDDKRKFLSMYQYYPKIFKGNIVYRRVGAHRVIDPISYDETYLKKAVSFYSVSIELVESIIDKTENDKKNLVGAYFRLSDIYKDLQMREEEIKCYHAVVTLLKNTIKLGESIIDKTKNDKENLVDAYFCLSDTYKDLQMSEEEIKCYHAAVTLKNTICESGEEDIENYGFYHPKLAALYKKQKKWEEAANIHEAAVDYLFNRYFINEYRLKCIPTLAQHLAEVAESYINLMQYKKAKEKLKYATLILSLLSTHDNYNYLVMHADAGLQSDLQKIYRSILEGPCTSLEKRLYGAIIKALDFDSREEDDAYLLDAQYIRELTEIKDELSLQNNVQIRLFRDFGVLVAFMLTKLECEKAGELDVLKKELNAEAVKLQLKELAEAEKKNTLFDTISGSSTLIHGMALKLRDNEFTIKSLQDKLAVLEDRVNETPTRKRHSLDFMPMRETKRARGQDATSDKPFVISSAPQPKNLRGLTPTISNAQIDVNPL